jgi:hypothetical protein
MNAARGWKIAVGMVLLFALGGVSGATFSAHRGAPAASRARLTDAWAQRWFAQTSARLELRQEQIDTLQPLLTQVQEQLRDLQKQTATRATDIIRTNARQMWGVLDETQRDRYRALPREHKLHDRYLPEPPTR